MTDYLQQEPKREEIDALAGPTLVEFGSAMVRLVPRGRSPSSPGRSREQPGVRHLKIADASGKRLGRSFGVKLWPTLVFLRDGKELATPGAPERRGGGSPTRWGRIHGFS